MHRSATIWKGTFLCNKTSSIAVHKAYIGCFRQVAKVHTSTISVPRWKQITIELLTLELYVFLPHAFHHYDVIPPSLSDFLPWKDEAPPLRMWPNREKTTLDSEISSLWDRTSAYFSSLVSLDPICEAWDERDALLKHFRALFLPNPS